MLVKQKITENKWIIFIIAILTPIIGAALYMIRFRVGINQLSIPCSDWNDEFWYYKMIESMIQFGKPLGYYGYNESHALVGNLGGWSFAMLIPFVGIGKIVGWNYMTPIIINLVLWIIGFAVVAIALKPSFSAQLFVSIAWLCYSVNIRYIFSAAPESLMTVMLLIYAVSVIRFSRNTKALGWLILADLMIVYLTLMRGYYILFIVVILAAMFKDSKKINSSIIIQVIVALIAVIAFVLIVHFCLAEYFVPDINTEWLTHPKAFIKAILLGFIESMQYVWQALLLQSMRGSWYILYFVLLPFIIYQCVKTKNLLYYSVLFSWVVLLVAMWTLYTAKEGCRHLMSASVVYIMVLAYLEHKQKYTYIIIAVLIYTNWLSQDSFYTQIKPVDEEQMEAIADGQAKLNELLELGDSEWDNTIISTRITKFNDLYAVPVGFALNSCLDDYVREHWDELNSKYIAYRPEGDLNDFLAERCEVVTKYGDTVVYKIR